LQFARKVDISLRRFASAIDQLDVPQPHEFHGRAWRWTGKPDSCVGQLEKEDHRTEFPRASPRRFHPRSGSRQERSNLLAGGKAAGDHIKIPTPVRAKEFMHRGRRCCCSRLGTGGRSRGARPTPTDDGRAQKHDDPGTHRKLGRIYHSKRSKQQCGEVA
jgi:hypothetical protein